MATLAPPKVDFINLANYNIKTKKSFNTFLQLPLVTEIVDSGQKLNDIVSKANSQFLSLSIQNTTIARKIIALSQSMEALLPGVDTKKGIPASVFFPTFIGQANTFEKQFKEKEAESKKFYTAFNKTIVKLSDRVAGISTQILKVSQEIEQESEKLQGESLLDILKRFFEQLFGITEAFSIADYFSISPSVFSDKNWWHSRQKNELIKKVVEKLKDLKKKLTVIKDTLNLLIKYLSTSFKGSINMVDFFPQLANILKKKQKEPKWKLHPGTLAAWKDLQTQANNYIQLVSTAVQGTLENMTIDKLNFVFPSSPKTRAEKTIYKAYLNAKYHPHTPAPQAPKLMLSKSKLPKGSENFSPPKDIAKKLKNMSDKSGIIIKKFNHVLQLPWLDSIKATDPNDSSKKTSMQDMITKMLKKYQQLQQNTIPLARDLFTYSQTQIALLPQVNQPGRITLDAYLKANNELVAGYQKRADAAWKAHLLFQQQWDLILNKAIQIKNEVSGNIIKWKKQLKDLEKKYKNAIVGSVLSFLGGALLTAAAFLSGGLLAVAAGAGAVALFAMGVAEAVKANKLLHAINALQSSIQTAESTIRKLDILIPLLKDISVALESFTQIWNNITTFLTAIRGSMSIWTSTLLKYLAPVAIKNWNMVLKNVTQYITDVSSGSVKSVKHEAFFTEHNSSVLPHCMEIKDHNVKVLKYIFENEKTKGMRMRALKKAKFAKPLKPFSPPNKTAFTLKSMAASTGKIISGFNEILQLPFVSSIKVNDTESLSDSITKSLKSYQKIQEKSVPVARELFTYSQTQAALLPNVNKPNKITLKDYLSTNTVLVSNYLRQARDLKKETEEYSKEFKALIKTLEENLTKLTEKLEQLKIDIKDKKKEWAGLTTGAVLGAVLGVAFTIGAIIALKSGKGDIAVALGTAAVASWGEMIYASVEAGKLQGIIDHLESIRDSVQTQITNIKKVIPKLTSIEGNLTAIVSSWEDIATNLNQISKNMKFWENPDNFTTANVTLTVGLWNNVKQATLDYLKAVGQSAPKLMRMGNSPRTFALHSLPKSLTIKDMMDINARVPAFNIATLLTAPAISMKSHTLTVLKEQSMEIQHMANEMRSFDNGLYNRLNSLKMESQMSCKQMVEEIQLGKSLADLMIDNVHVFNHKDFLRKFLDFASVNCHKLKDASVDSLSHFKRLVNDGNLLNDDLNQRKRDFDNKINMLNQNIKEIEHKQRNPPWYVFIPGGIGVVAWVAKLAVELKAITMEKDKILSRLHVYDKTLYPLNGVMSISKSSLSESNQLSSYFSRIDHNIGTAYSWLHFDYKIPENMLESISMSWKNMKQQLQNI